MVTSSSVGPVGVSAEIVGISAAFGVDAAGFGAVGAAGVEFCIGAELYPPGAPFCESAPLSSMITLSATISVLYLLTPSSPSQFLVWSFPSA